MIFHTPEPGFKALTAMCKRASRFAAPGRIDSAHRLAAAWSNVKLMNSAWSVPAASGDCLYPAMALVPHELAVDMRNLDWFAGKVDAYCKDKLVTGDSTFAAICHEWLRALWFLPPGLPGDVVAKIMEVRA